MVFIIFRRKRNYFLQQTITCFTLFAFSFAGYLSISFHYHKNNNHLNIEKITQKQAWIAEIKQLPREREKSYKVIAKLSAISDSTYWITKKVVLYFQKDSEIKQWNVGDQFIIHTKLSFIEPPKNPEQFNYQEFMKKKGILLTGYVGKQNWEKMGGETTITIKRYASYLQRLLSNKLIESGMSGAEFSVAAAILLGNDETLEPELRASYAATGVSHILCVSGMHVGVIFMILNFLLQPLDRSVRTRYIKNLILLAAVWIYANITGLAPSVTRSATMFTFVITSKFLQRKTNVFHSLFTSLFILLTLNPLLIFELGFQLSYLAVFSIVLFQEKLARWVQPKSKVGKYFWDLISVSIAAQMATSPIAVFYFEQFPNYFLLTNLFVIPMSFVMTILGVATLAFSFSSFISNGLGFLLNFEVKIMNEIIYYIEKIPGALTPNISINVAQVLLMYAMILIGYIFRNNIRKLLIFNILLLNFIFLIHSIELYKNKHHIDVVNYDISKGTAFQFCYHGKAVIFSDSIHSNLDKRYLMSIKSHDTKKRLINQYMTLDEDFENTFLCKRGNYIFFQDRIYVLERNRLKPNVIHLVVYDNNFSEGSIHKLE
jgi:competence protein ComEC